MIQSQLLFFDTFSHDTQSLGQPQEINLDLVQFPSPVYIREVRVIPLGSKVTANLPGGMRLGATNPSKFDLELFVNNLAAPGASTFENVGSLHYNQAGSISLACSPEIATDGLVLRGLYSTITLAVYGSLSDCTPEQLARQGAAAREAVKEEPELELPGTGAGGAGATDNGRSLGEAYAAQWTEKHSDQALKAEPPDEDNWAVGGVKVEAAEKTNGNRFASGDKEVRTKGYYENDGDIKREKVTSPDRDDGSKLGDRSPRNPDRTRKRYSDGYRSTSRDRARSPPVSRNRDRDKSRDRDRSRDRDLLRDRSRDRFSRERDRSADRFSRDKDRIRDRRSRSKDSRELRDKHNDRGKERDRTPDRSDRFRDRRLSPDLRTSKRDRTQSPRDRRSLSRARSRTPTRRERERSRSPRRFSRSRSPDKKSYRSASRDRDRDRFPNDRFRPSSSLNKDSRDYNRPVTPTRDRFRDNFRENHISDSRRPRSPVSRDRSPHDYDKTSLHSSGSRRLLSPRSSPRRRGTRSPSPRFRRDRSRSVSGSRRSRSPRSPNITNGNHVKHRTPERNGFKSSSPTPAKEITKELSSLDAVSDISEGDIPDDPDNDADGSGLNEDRINEEDDLATTRSSIAKEDVEEISDEEAEWSDDFETGVYSDTDIEVGDDLEDPVVYFNPADINLKRFESLSDPTENLLDQIKNNKVSASKSEKPFMDTIDAILWDVYDEKFIETIEGLTKNIQIELAFFSEEEIPDIKLVKIVTSSIHFENAMKQLKPPSKVRQLKSGLKLLIEMLKCGGSLTDKLLESDIQANLLSLYTRDHMAMSLKLLILRALDTSLSSVAGIEQFINKNLFGKLLQLSGENQSSRTQFSFSSILTKLDLNDQLYHLNSVISQTDHLDENSDAICDLFENLRTVFLDINLRMSQPARFLPSQLHYDTSLTQFGSPKTCYFSLVSQHGVLEVITCLLACPDTSDLEPVVTSLHRLLSSWMVDEAGLMYLASQSEQTGAIVRTLMGTRGETETEEPEVTKKDSTDDLEGPTTGYELGFHLNQLVMAVSFMDTIQRDVKAANMVRLDMETSDTYSAIANLFGMTLTPRGREAVVSVVTMGSMADNIIALTKHNSEDGKKDMKKSAIRGFASEILLLVIRSSDNVQFLRRYGTQLITMGNSDSHSKLSELVGWCAPLTDPVVFTEDGIPVLAGLVRQRLEQSEAEQSPQQTKSESILSSELVTAVRLLRDHVSPRTRPRSHLDMKYKTAAIVMFSNDLVELFTQLLDRITADHEQPHLHTATFIGSRGATIVSILQPVLASLRVILEAVIEARDTEFQDMSVLPALLRTHSLLSVVPMASVYHSQARDTTEDLVKCLLAFTKPNVDLAKNKVSKSLWTQMLSSLLSYISSMPAVLLSSLGLFSQILPLPLPLPSPRDLTSEEETTISTSRKLWSAHLHPLRSHLSRVLSDVSAYSYPPLLQLLRKVCEQLSSLSPPIALIVVTSLVTSIQETEPGPAITRMMEFLVWCVTQPAIKTVLLDSMASDALQRAALIGCLEHGLAGDCETQAGAIRVIQTLCDPEISLSGENLDLSLSESLPDKETLQSLISCLLATSETKGFSSQSSLFSCLMAVTETKYMCDLIRWSLLTNSGKEKYMFLLLKRMAVEFSTTSSDFESFLTFVNHLHNPDLKDDNILTLVELGMALGWLCPDESSQQSTERRRTHPLVVLSNRIKEIESENQDLSLTNTSVKYSELITLLESLPSDASLPSPEPPTVSLPPPRTPLELWAARDTVVGAGDISSEQLSMVYWTHGDMEVDTGAETATQTLDLLGVSQKYLSGLDIQSAAKEVTKERTLATERKKKGVKKSMMETKVLQNKNIISAFKDGKHVNLRGRGFARTTFKSDQFRTRPPNTSRPPSLHVDDFLVLELKGQQPTGPTGYNKQSVKAAKELFAQREADAMLKPPQMMREATREPVGVSRGRGRGERGGERSGATRGFRGSSSNGRFRRESRGWSPTSSEPRDLGREARPGPREDRRGGGRGSGSYRGDRGDRRGSGGGRGDRKFSRGGGRR